MWPTCLEEWFQRSTTFFYIFSYKCDLVKCCCPFFRRGKKRIFVSLNANISQSTWWKILEFFPHLLNLPYYKILRLHVSKNDIFQKIGTCTRNGSFWVLFVITQLRNFRGNNTSTKFQGQKIYQRKDIRNLLTCVVVKCFSLLPTLTLSQGLNFFFHMNFCYKTIYMLITCVKNFKFKRSTQK